jgi:hypothetical protein
MATRKSFSTIAKKEPRAVRRTSSIYLIRQMIREITRLAADCYIGVTAKNSPTYPNRGINAQVEVELELIVMELRSEKLNSIGCSDCNPLPTSAGSERSRSK